MQSEVFGSYCHDRMQNCKLEQILSWGRNSFDIAHSCLSTDAAHKITLPVYSSPLCSGILRYRVDFQGMEYQGEDDEFFDLDDY